MHHLLRLSPASRYTLQLVNSFSFRDVAMIPLPQLHINSCVLPQVPNPVSVRRLVLATGRGSGLALEFRRILANPRWFDAWFWIQEEEHRISSVVNVWYRVR